MKGMKEWDEFERLYAKLFSLDLNGVIEDIVPVGHYARSLPSKSKILYALFYDLKLAIENLGKFLVAVEDPEVLKEVK